MKNLNKIAMAALFMGSIGTMNAQGYVGEECGCPDLGSRTTVSVSTLVTGGDFTSNQVWTCDNTYILDNAGPVYVGDGFTLTIEPGTIIKGETGSGAAANSLVVSRGGQIFANGTKECRIVFTSINDVDVDGSYPVTNTSEWGSLLILGRAKNNLRDGNSLQVGAGDGQGVIEGLSASDSRNYYGVADNSLDGIVTSDFQNTESSGVVKYVSLRHGGTVIGSDNEINGLTLGSVGSGTVLEHIEIVANEDDGIEFFGGTANLKYASVLFCQDDYLDVDQAYTGNVQYFFGIQTDEQSGLGGTLGDHIIEADGEDSNGSQPAVDKGNAQIFNVTGINNNSDDCVELKAAFRGTVANSIFVNGGTGFNFAQGETENNFINDELILAYNNSFDDVTTLSIPASTAALFATNLNSTEAGVLPGYEFDPTSPAGPSNNVEAVPANGSAGNVGPVPAGIDPVQFRGAFKPGQEAFICGGFLDSDLGGLGNIPNGCRSDLNGDGLIDTQDFGIFGSDFVSGTCTSN